MPDFWQFPTGSMGIGPISSIYHARFMRYLTHRDLLELRRPQGVGRVRRRRDGRARIDERADAGRAREARQPGVGGQLQPAAPRRPGARQRPHHRRAGKALSPAPAGTSIKLVWGSDWDGLFARDASGALARAFANTVDGQMQTFAAKDGRFNRDNFFGQNPELARLVAGHDRRADRPPEARRPRPGEDPRRLCRGRRPQAASPP